MCGICETLDVDHLEGRIGRALEIEQSAAAGDLPLDLLMVVGGAESRLDPEAGEELDEDLVRAAVRVFDGDHPVAGREEGEERVADRGHAGGEAGGGLGGLQLADLLLEHFDGGIGVAGVDVSGLVSGGDLFPLVEVVVGEGDAVVDGCDGDPFRAPFRLTAPDGAGGLSPPLFGSFRCHAAS